MTRLATCMMASMRTIRKMEWVSSHGRVVTFIKDATKMMRDMDMVRCTGRMAHAIRANG